MKYKESSDKETVRFIKEQLIKNNGYCPSIIDSNGVEEFRCPCKDFEENTKKGETCRCGLYVKVKK